MSGPGVIFDGVWKKFRLGERHDSLRDLVPAIVRRLAGRGRGDALEREEFWALRDVSFEVTRGEALGIIGPNGAGKSTVLKLLNKIMKPTRGHCEVRGRVGALIELAAGFHPDLTGRENVYLQGAIMGMRRAEISRTFDEIVEFAGIGEFLDTPVKRYSSGMHARLGFAIAAHLDPDVLLIDEVLAVGDFEFQQKAFDRLAEIVRRDIPVVVVSHQLDRVATLCRQALLLQQGSVVRRGSAAECIAAYVMRQAEPGAAPAGDDEVILERVRLEPAGPVPSGGHVTIVLTGAAVPGAVRRADTVTLRIRASQTGQVVYATSNARCGLTLPASGPFELEATLQMNLPEGIYFLETSVRNRRQGRILGAGPFATIEVHGGPTFAGTVQLNVAMRLHALQSVGPTGS